MFEFDKQKAEDWLNQSHIPPRMLTHEMLYDDEFKSWIKNFDKKYYDGLFESGVMPTRTPPKWKIQSKCSMCGEKFIRLVNKSDLLCWLKSYRGYDHDVFCPACTKIKLEEKENKEYDYLEKKRLNTLQYITYYLNIHSAWKPDTKVYDMKSSLMMSISIDIETIAQHIKSMNYSDFLRTPYWIGISNIVKKKHNFKCQLCGSNKNLNVHHSNYDIHGYEIMHLDSLTVLCSDCHKKFHGVKE